MASELVFGETESIDSNEESSFSSKTCGLTVIAGNIIGLDIGLVTGLKSFLTGLTGLVIGLTGLFDVSSFASQFPAGAAEPSRRCFSVQLDSPWLDIGRLNTVW